MCWYSTGARPSAHLQRNGRHAAGPLVRGVWPLLVPALRVQGVVCLVVGWRTGGGAAACARAAQRRHTCMLPVLPSPLWDRLGLACAPLLSRSSLGSLCGVRGSRQLSSNGLGINGQPGRGRASRTWRCAACWGTRPCCACPPCCCGSRSTWRPGRWRCPAGGPHPGAAPATPILGPLGPGPAGWPLKAPTGRAGAGGGRGWECWDTPLFPA